jgi:hypothetical protein
MRSFTATAEIDVLSSEGGMQRVLILHREPEGVIFCLLALAIILLHC